jgi:predicted TIM-barrel fold metal-dependent hydrolase
MLVTDAQVHLWESERPERPWPKPQARPPHRPNGFSAEEMLAEMDTAGVDRAIIVPPTWAGDSNDWALDMASRYPARFAVVGRFDARAPDAQRQLAGWLQNTHMLGVRMSFHVKPFIDWLDDGSLDWFWAECASLALPVMALVPGNVGRLRPVLMRHPELRILIPHMGCPLDIRGSAAFAGIEELLDLAGYPNVTVMVSSAPCFSNQPYPFGDVHPYLRRIYDVYGPRRMLWGADLSRLTSSYSECLDLFRHALDFLSDADKGWILGRALAEALNWPEEG